MEGVSFTKKLSPRFASPKVGGIKTVNKASEWSFHIVYSSQALAWSQNGILMEKLGLIGQTCSVYFQAHSREWSTNGELILCTNKYSIVLRPQINNLNSIVLLGHPIAAYTCKVKTRGHPKWKNLTWGKYYQLHWSTDNVTLPPTRVWRNGVSQKTFVQKRKLPRKPIGEKLGVFRHHYQPWIC